MTTKVEIHIYEIFVMKTCESIIISTIIDHILSTFCVAVSVILSNNTLDFRLKCKLYVLSLIEIYFSHLILLSFN